MIKRDDYGYGVDDGAVFEDGDGYGCGDEDNGYEGDGFGEGFGNEYYAEALEGSGLGNGSLTTSADVDAGGGICDSEYDDAIFAILKEEKP